MILKFLKQKFYWVFLILFLAENSDGNVKENNKCTNENQLEEGENEEETISLTLKCLKQKLYTVYCSTNVSCLRDIH